ncbi:MAG: 3-deoxy-D-manno-octulosonic acid transferase [Phycisphaerae bacterium]
MVLILDLIYFLGLLAASPFLFIKSWRTGKYRTDWRGRLGQVSPQATEILRAYTAWPRVLIHCVSVGELLSTRKLVEELLQGHEKLLIVISTTTDTGMARALALYPPRAGARVLAVRYPLDFSFAVRKFLDTVNPSVIALVELETWPNFLIAAGKRRIPVQIINGRMTIKSLQRYRIIKPLMRRMLRPMDHIGVQTPEIADRFAKLGAISEHVEVIPTMKYDSADFADEIPGAPAMAAALGVLPEQRLFVAGSTGPGEQDILLAAYKALRNTWPKLRLAIAPRKPEVVPEVITAIRLAGLEPVLRTQRPDGDTGSPIQSGQVIVMDTMGELKKLYSLAFAVFSGRSLVNLGGSDMIEVVALAKPCCFGPYTFNFSDVVALLTADGAGVVVKSAAELESLLGEWLAHPEKAMAMGQRARACLESQRGGSGIYAQGMLQHIPAAPVTFN